MRVFYSRSALCIYVYVSDTRMYVQSYLAVCLRSCLLHLYTSTQCICDYFVVNLQMISWIHVILISGDFGQCDYVNIWWCINDVLLTNNTSLVTMSVITYHIQYSEYRISYVIHGNDFQLSSKIISNCHPSDFWWLFVFKCTFSQCLHGVSTMKCFYL